MEKPYLIPADYVRDNPFAEKHTYKIYHDGSHPVATRIVRSQGKRPPKKPAQTAFDIAFDSLYFQAKRKGLSGDEMADYIQAGLTKLYPASSTLRKFILEKMDKKQRNLWKRIKRFKRKVNMNRWNYFVTFTCDPKKHTEESFRKKLRKCLSNLHTRRGWKYMGVFEYGEANGSIHFHALIYVPENEMIGELVEKREYSKKRGEVRTRYERPYNLMEGGYDKGELPSYDTNIIEPAFLDYVNEYNEYVTKRGATLVYAFTPVNGASIPLDTTQEDVDIFYNYLTENLNFPVLGNPHDYIMDCEWFYDSNVHCNTAGAVVYTRQLTKDLKVYLGDTTPTKIEIPEKPALPDENETMGGENKDAQYFIYEETKNGVQIIGLTEEGAKQTALILPATYNGMAVTGFSATTFAGNSVIQEIRIQRNIRSIENASFSACTNLKALYLAEGEAPSRCKVNTGFLEGAEQLKIYVEKDKLVDYINDYFWSRYAANIVGY